MFCTWPINHDTHFMIVKLVSVFLQKSNIYLCTTLFIITLTPSTLSGSSATNVPHSNNLSSITSRFLTRHHYEIPDQSTLHKTIYLKFILTLSFHSHLPSTDLLPRSEPIRDTATLHRKHSVIFLIIGISVFMFSLS